MDRNQKNGGRTTTLIIVFQMTELYSKGIEYYRGKQFDKAFECLQKAANCEYIDAYHSLAYMYEHGEGVDKNLKKALEYYQKAAEKGHFGSKNNIGRLYLNGIGVDKDEKKAFESFLNAITIYPTFADAHYNLAICYENGFGTRKDELKATKHYLLSAKYGDQYACEKQKELIDDILQKTKKIFQYEMKEQIHIYELAKTHYYEIDSKLDLINLLICSKRNYLELPQNFLQGTNLADQLEKLKRSELSLFLQTISYICPELFGSKDLDSEIASFLF